MAAQGLEVIDAEALREHYAKTLWHWCERLEANADAARARGRRGKVPRLAHLPRGVGARVRTRLAVAVAAARRQAAPRRPAAASADTRLHVPGARATRACRALASRSDGLQSRRSATICGG